MTDPKPEIAAAADWWASRLGGGRTDAGEAELNVLLAGERSRTPKRTAEERAAFRAALLDTLEQHVAPHWDSTSYRASAMRAVKVDYDPAPELADAAAAAGIELGMGEMPVKTVMWIDHGAVTVKEGYGARRVLAWSSPEWERPPCGKHHQEGDHRSYRVFNEVCAKPLYHEDNCGDWVPDTKRCVKCGGTYVEHESMEAYARPDSCPDWYREDA